MTTCITIPYVKFEESNNLVSERPDKETHDEEKHILYIFDLTDTLLHRLIESNKATKIIDLVLSKLLTSILILANIVYIVWASIISGASKPYLIYKLVIVSLNMIWGIFVCLSLNCKAFKLSLKSFVFWFKILTVFEICIIYGILVYYFDYDHLETYLCNYLEMIGFIINTISTILMIIIFCSIDSINADRTYKIVMGIGVSSTFTIWAVHVSFMSQDYSHWIINITSYIHLDLFSLYASGLRVLSIFLWKSTILSFWKHNKGINIRHSPNIKWI